MESKFECKNCAASKFKQQCNYLKLLWILIMIPITITIVEHNILGNLGDMVCEFAFTKRKRIEAGFL